MSHSRLVQPSPVIPLVFYARVRYAQLVLSLLDMAISTVKDVPFRVVEVQLGSALLESVSKLHSVAKARLGLFPQGAFEDYAREKMILAAVTPKGEIAGYLLYRVARRSTKNRASIVHLTADTAHRGKGVARLLVNELKSRTTHLLGISLRCRRDYCIDAMWQSFGFTVRNSREGRGADGAILDYWWYGHQHDDLFSQAIREDGNERVLIAIDANVFYDLTRENRPHGEDSRVLQADWIQGSVMLCVTQEIYNEIHRSPDEQARKQGRIAAQSFHELKTDEADVRALESPLTPLFNGAVLDRDLSDLRQVAHAIAAEVPFFVTRDGPMLSRGPAIFERYGLRVLHPTDLINHFDVLQREAEYRPSRLEGSRWRERLVVGEDVDSIVSLFRHRTNERVGTFEQQVRHYLAQTKSWASKLVVDGSKSPTVYTVHVANGDCPFEVRLLRHTDHALSGTLLRHLIHELSREVGRDSIGIIKVTDRGLSDEAKSALTELGFILDSEAWWKLSIKGICSRETVVARIRATEIPMSLKERLVGASLLADGTVDTATAYRLERLFCPCKIAPSVLPCYLVSIRQGWAAHFFDIPVGGQTLMDLNERLHLGIEGAYYCSSHNTHVAGPGRILWYVSGQGAMSVKACSQLDESVVDGPKEIYARFRHLGVYSWNNVFEITNGDLNGRLMALKFSRTERFVRPVSLAELQKMQIPSPQNPRRISEEQYAAIYRLGMNLPGDE